LRNNLVTIQQPINYPDLGHEILLNPIDKGFSKKFKVDLTNSLSTELLKFMNKGLLLVCAI